MKRMICRELGGACDKEFIGETFEDISRMSREHGIEMFQAGDRAHIAAMEAMKEIMSNQELMYKWLEDKKRVFEEREEYEAD